MRLPCAVAPAPAAGTAPLNCPMMSFWMMSFWRHALEARPLEAYRHARSSTEVDVRRGSCLGRPRPSGSLLRLACRLLAVGPSLGRGKGPVAGRGRLREGARDRLGPARASPKLGSSGIELSRVGPSRYAPPMRHGRTPGNGSSRGPSFPGDGARPSAAALGPGSVRARSPPGRPFLQAPAGGSVISDRFRYFARFCYFAAAPETAAATVRAAMTRVAVTRQTASVIFPAAPLA